MEYKIFLMESSNLLDRYVWLVDLLVQNRYMSFAEIDEAWGESDLNPKKEPMPKKTFQNHCAKIKSLFGIEIKCTHRGTYQYHIVEKRDAFVTGVRSWLYNSFALNSIVASDASLSSRIVLEKLPLGVTKLSPVLKAMKNSKMLRIEFRSYRSRELSVKEVVPYCLKIYHLVWYLLARDRDSSALHIYNMERVTNVEEIDYQFTMPPEFNAGAFFSNYLGVIVPEKPEVETILLKVKDGQEEYLRSIPWHHSQKEVVTGPDYAVFEFRMCITADLIQKILSQGYLVEVLAPESLKERVKNVLLKMNEIYGL